MPHANQRPPRQRDSASARIRLRAYPPGLMNLDAFSLRICLSFPKRSLQIVTSLHGQSGVDGRLYRTISCRQSCEIGTTYRLLVSLTYLVFSCLVSQHRPLITRLVPTPVKVLGLKHIEDGQLAERSAGKDRPGNSPFENRGPCMTLQSGSRRRQHALSRAQLKTAVAYYMANRNCAPVSKHCLASTLTANLTDWMEKPILEIDTIMLQERYHAVIGRVKAQGNKLEARYAQLPPRERLLRASPGYFSGLKAANDTVKGFGRVFRYWVAKHSGQLHQAGITPPPCPTLALMDDVIAEPQRVRSIPWSDLRKLFESFPNYPGNPLHPLLVRLLLASGRRVGALISCRMEYIQSHPSPRIVIPPDAERTKVPWRKRHLPHLAHVIPVTAEIASILKEIEHVAPLCGDANTWLFPSRTASSGHMQEERMAVKGLRAHANIRFTLHQLRHNVATAAEELGHGKAEIAELLGHNSQTVTDRYIDERTKRHSQQLDAVSGMIRALMGYRDAADRKSGHSSRGSASSNAIREARTS